MKMKFRVGIIGCGVICENHIIPLIQNSNTELVAVCDIVKDKALNIANKFECNAYFDYKEMLKSEKLDSVHICLPHYLHSEVAIYAMQNGVDVLCEKPMDISYKNACLMKKISIDTGKNLGIIFQNRYSTGPKFIKEKFKNGDLGRIVSASAELMWYRDQEYYDSAYWRGKWATEGGGVTINQAVHTLDMLRYLIDCEVEEVKATLSHKGKTNVEVEDTCEGTIFFKNDVKAVFFFSNNFVGFQPPRIVLNCENATVEIKGPDAAITYSNGITESIYHNDEVVQIGKQCYGTGHFAQINEFYSSDRVEKAKAMLEEALKTQEILEMIYKCK